MKLIFEVEAGDRVDRVAGQLCRISAIIGCKVVAKFHDDWLEAWPGTVPEGVVNEWRRLQEMRSS
jgi:hypothetical protein